MSRTEEIRKSVAESTPVLAFVGATDVAAQKVREAVANAPAVRAEVEAKLEAVRADVQKRVEGFDPASVPAKVQQLPSAVQHVPAALQQVTGVVIARSLTAAAKGQAAYEDFAERGKVLVGRVREQKATQDLVHQSKVTISRTKAAVSTGRKGAGETLASAKATLTTSKTQADDASQAVKEGASAALDATTTAAKKTTTTARKRATATKTATKTAVTSAKKTASKAADATKAAADKVGDETGAAKAAPAAPTE